MRLGFVGPRVCFQLPPQIQPRDVHMKEAALGCGDPRETRLTTGINYGMEVPVHLQERETIEQTACFF